MQTARISNAAAVGLMFAALALTLVPLPWGIAVVRPDFVAVVMLALTIAAPERFGLFTAFVLGLALDVLTGDLLGQNAVALLTVTYVALRFHLRIRAFPVSQVVITFALLLLLNQFLLIWVDGAIGEQINYLPRLGTVGTGVIMLFVLLSVLATQEREARATFEISA